MATTDAVTIMIGEAIRRDSASEKGRMLVTKASEALIGVPTYFIMKSQNAVLTEKRQNTMIPITESESMIITGSGNSFISFFEASLFITVYAVSFHVLTYKYSSSDISFGMGDVSVSILPSGKLSVRRSAWSACLDIFVQSPP